MHVFYIKKNTKQNSSFSSYKPKSNQLWPGHCVETSAWKVKTKNERQNWLQNHCHGNCCAAFTEQRPKESVLSSLPRDQDSRLPNRSWALSKSQTKVKAYPSSCYITGHTVKGFTGRQWHLITSVSRGLWERNGSLLTSGAGDLKFLQAFSLLQFIKENPKPNSSSGT